MGYGAKKAHQPSPNQHGQCNYCQRVHVADCDSGPFPAGILGPCAAASKPQCAGDDDCRGRQHQKQHEKADAGHPEVVQSDIACNSIPFVQQLTLAANHFRDNRTDLVHDALATVATNYQQSSFMPPSLLSLMVSCNSSSFSRESSASCWTLRCWAGLFFVREVTESISFRISTTAVLYGSR